MSLSSESASSKPVARKGPGAGKPCKHCGTPSPEGSEFCCAGCAYVFRIIHDEGLDDYYKIKDEVTVPADAALGQSRDMGWLTSLQAEAEVTATEAGRTPRL